jgi:hypothetical protein
LLSTSKILHFSGDQLTERRLKGPVDTARLQADSPSQRLCVRRRKFSRAILQMDITATVRASKAENPVPLMLCRHGRLSLSLIFRYNNGRFQYAFVQRMIKEFTIRILADREAGSRNVLCNGVLIRVRKIGHQFFNCSTDRGKKSGTAQGASSAKSVR